MDGRPAALQPQGPGAQDQATHPTAARASGFASGCATGARPRPVIDPDGAKDGWIPTADGAFVAERADRARRPGSPATTIRPTRPPTTSRSRSRGAPRRSPTARSQDGPTHRHCTDLRLERGLADGDLPRHGRPPGRFRVTRSNVNGIPSYVAVDPAESAATPGGAVAGPPASSPVRLGLRRLSVRGSTGAIVDHASAVGYALETQTRPLFPQAPGTGLTSPTSWRTSGSATP